MNKSHLINKLINAQLIKYGNFVLKSGQTSNIYFNLKSLVSHPKLLQEIAFEIAKYLEPIPSNCVIAGVPMGAISIATCVSMITQTPLIMIREEKKTYGLQNLIEGDYEGKKCILIEDVVTTGQSVLETIGLVESQGVQIERVVTILDREAGGFEKIKERGYEIQSLFTMSDLTQINCVPESLVQNELSQYIYKLACHKKTNLIASLDVDTPSRLFRLIDEIGPYIVGIKIHLDIIEFDPMIISFERFNHVLRKIKKRYGFVVIEDHKYADIASIVSKQFDQVNGPIDIVTAHAISGESMVKELDKKEIGILLIHQLSTPDHLISPVYSYEVERMTSSCKNLVGLVSQEKVRDYFIYTPGICLESNQNQYGQSYRTPEEAGASGTDYFIVGRGIYLDKEPAEKAKMYREACWNSWKRIKN